MKDYFQNELHQTIIDIFLAIKITSTIVGQWSWLDIGHLDIQQQVAPNSYRVLGIQNI